MPPLRQRSAAAVSTPSGAPPIPMTTWTLVRRTAAVIPADRSPALIAHAQRFFQLERLLQQALPVSQRNLAEIVRAEKKKVECIEPHGPHFRSSAEGCWICIRC